MEIVAKENKVTIMDHEFGHLTEEIVDDPLAIPKRITEGWKPYLADELPDAFCGKNSMFKIPVPRQDLVNYGSISKHSDKCNLYMK